MSRVFRLDMEAMALAMDLSLVPELGAAGRLGAMEPNGRPYRCRVPAQFAVGALETAEFVDAGVRVSLS